MSKLEKRYANRCQLCTQDTLRTMHFFPRHEEESRAMTREMALMALQAEGNKDAKEVLLLSHSVTMTPCPCAIRQQLTVCDEAANHCAWL
jgi:GTP cyclohydrolase FolE2